MKNRFALLLSLAIAKLLVKGVNGCSAIDRRNIETGNETSGTDDEDFSDNDDVLFPYAHLYVNEKTGRASAPPGYPIRSALITRDTNNLNSLSKYPSDSNLYYHNSESEGRRTLSAPCSPTLSAPYSPEKASRRTNYSKYKMHKKFKCNDKVPIKEFLYNKKKLQRASSHDSFKPKNDGKKVKIKKFVVNGNADNVGECDIPASSDSISNAPVNNQPNATDEPLTSPSKPAIIIPPVTTNPTEKKTIKSPVIKSSDSVKKERNDPIETGGGSGVYTDPHTAANNDIKDRSSSNTTAENSNDSSESNDNSDNSEVSNDNSTKTDINDNSDNSDKSYNSDNSNNSNGNNTTNSTSTTNTTISGKVLVPTPNVLPVSVSATASKVNSATITVTTPKNLTVHDAADDDEEDFVVEDPVEMENMRSTLQRMQMILLFAAAITFLSILIYSIYYINLIRKIYSKDRITE